MSPSTVTLDHLYAKKETLLEEDLFSGSTDFLSTWNEVNLAHFHTTSTIYSQC